MENKTSRVIVAHPGKQHSFRLASALKKAGFLECYCTTVYDKRGSIAMRCAKLFARGKNRKRAENRKNLDLTDNEVVQFCELLGLITILLARLDKSKNRTFYRKMNGITSDLFGRKVAKLAIKRKVDAVICYDSGARVCFEVLKKKAPDIKRIMDVSHAARPEEKRIIEKEVNDTGVDVLKQECLYLWNEKTLEKFQKEIDLSEYFICPSNFVIKTLNRCGVNVNQCHRVPYGANIQNVARRETNNQIIKFIYVGSLCYGKGMHYLLEAFSQIDPSKAELNIVGFYERSSPLYQKYCYMTNVHFVGWVLQDKLKELYSESDVFVIFSPTEGLAQVGIEAMSCGLPVICADSTGVNDLISEEVNGFVVPYSDVVTLKNKMQWMIDNRDKIEMMRKESYKIALDYTWEKYEDRVVEAIIKILNQLEGKK